MVEVDSRSQSLSILMKAESEYSTRCCSIELRSLQAIYVISLQAIKRWVVNVTRALAT